MDIGLIISLNLIIISIILGTSLKTWKIINCTLENEYSCPHCRSSNTRIISRVWNMSYSEKVECCCTCCGHKFSFMLCD